MASSISPLAPGSFPQPREVLKGWFCLLSTPPHLSLNWGWGQCYVVPFPSPLLRPLPGKAQDLEPHRVGV